MVTMRKLLITAVSSVVLAAPVMAQVDPKIHKLCIEAKDYAGCVRSMNGDTSTPSTTRVITSQGADIAEGNQCPAGSAYVGGGNCQQVTCHYNPSLGFVALGHDSILAGKPGWKCKWSFWEGAGVLRLTGGTFRASNSPKCPSGEPPIGYNSTCQIGMDDKESISESTRSSTPKRPGEY
jgi:hypothetical protein